MGHGITATDAIFSVRSPAWHGLAHVWDDYPTREQAQAAVLNWEPIPEPLYRKVPYIRPHEHNLLLCGGAERGCELTDDFGEAFQEVPDFVMNVRSDNSAALGVVSSTFELVKNDELCDIAESIEGLAKGLVKFETGGSIMGGRKVWLLLRLAEPITISGDPHGETVIYYALQNSHDGSGALRGQAVNTRIVCQNTSAASDLEAKTRGTEFVFRHTKNVGERIEEAKAALRGWRESIRDYRLLMEHLITLPVSEAGARTFIEEFIPMPPPHAVSQRVINNVETARGQLRGALESVTCEGIDRTAYGLVAASIEYLNWHRKARSAETRFARTYLTKNAVVSDAVEIARKVAVG